MLNTQDILSHEFKKSDVLVYISNIRSSVFCIVTNFMKDWAYQFKVPFHFSTILCSQILEWLMGSISKSVNDYSGFNGNDSTTIGLNFIMFHVSFRFPAIRVTWQTFAKYIQTSGSKSNQSILVLLNNKRPNVAKHQTSIIYKQQHPHLKTAPL